MIVRPGDSRGPEWSVRATVVEIQSGLAAVPEKVPSEVAVDAVGGIP
jgi:hypothetical protein